MPIRSAPWRRGALLLALYSALTIVVCPALLVFGAVDLPDEFLEFCVADLSFWARELRLGHWPQWDPYRLGGGSVFASPACLGPPYPSAVLLPWVPLDVYVLVGWVLHLAMGAVGVHAMARTRGGSVVASFGAGALWLCSTTVVASLVDGQLDVAALLGWLPLALLGVDRAIHAAGSPSPRALRQALPAVACVGLALGAIGLGSHARFAAFGFVAVAVHAACCWMFAEPHARPAALRWGCLAGLSLGLGGLLCAPTVLPEVLEVLASRSGPPPADVRLVGQALSPAGLTGLVFPRAMILDERWYHLGAVSLLVGCGLRRDRVRIALLVSGGMMLALGMGLRGPLGVVLKPVLWAIYPVETGAAALGVPFLAVAAGLSLDRVGRGRHRRAAVIVALIGGVALAIGYHASRGLYLPEVRAMQHLSLASLVHGAVALGVLVILLVLGRRLGARRLGFGLLALLLADGLAYAWRTEASIVSFVARPSAWLRPGADLDGLLQPGPPGRILGYPLIPERSFQEGVPDDMLSHSGHGWGHDPGGDPVLGIPLEAASLLNQRLARNAGTGNGLPQIGGRAKVPPMPWSAVIEELASPDPRTAPPDWEDSARQRRLLDLLHTRWIVSTAGAPVAAGLAELPPAPDRGARRFAVQDPRPFALLTPGLRTFGTVPEALEAILAGQVDPAHDAVVLERHVTAEMAARPGRPRVGSVVDWGPGRWTVDLPPSEGGILTIAERFHTGWTARDGDGAALPVARVNLVQLGVLVPPGTERAELRFRAPGVGLGRALGVLGLLLLLALALLGRTAALDAARPR